ERFRTRPRKLWKRSLRAHKVRMAARRAGFRQMPERCQAPHLYHCPFRAKHWSLTGDLGHGRLFGMCEWHFRFYNLMSRRWRRSEPEAPEIVGVHTDVPTL